MSKQAFSKSGATPTRKLGALGGSPSAAQQKAQEIANDIYARSTDLEVFVRHKVYPPTVAQINGIQSGLNRLRPHVRANLKKKSQAQWQGWSQDSSASAFFGGMLIGLRLGWLIFAPHPSTLLAPADSGEAKGRLTKSKPSR